jgi:hypothetical protein
MRMLRMTIASRKTAVAIAMPKSLRTRSSPAAKDAKTTTCGGDRPGLHIPARRSRRAQELKPHRRALIEKALFPGLSP